MLQIENLHATVAGKPILNGLTLTVPTGEVLKRLPMEFAFEAQKLLGTSLEGQVG